MDNFVAKKIDEIVLIMQKGFCRSVQNVNYETRL